MSRVQIIPTTQGPVPATSVDDSEAGVIIAPWVGRGSAELADSGLYELTDTLTVPVGPATLLSVIASITVAQPADVGSYMLIEAGATDIAPMSVTVGEEEQIVYNQSGGVASGNYDSEMVVTIFGTFAFIPTAEEIAIRFGVSIDGAVVRQAYWEGVAAVFVKYGSRV